MNNIHKIYYINLIHRLDRNDHMIALLKSYEQKTERFDAIVDIKGAIGCTKSHIAILKLAILNNLQNVMICEDDLEIPNIIMLEQKLRRFFDDNIHWDVLVICGVIKRKINSKNKDYCRLIKSQTTACYVVNNQYFSTLLDNYEKGLSLFQQSHNDSVHAVDRFMNSLQKTDYWYCLLPMVAYQMPNYSDIRKIHVDAIHTFEQNK